MAVPALHGLLPGLLAALALQRLIVRAADIADGGDGAHGCSAPTGGGVPAPSLERSASRRPKAYQPTCRVQTKIRADPNSTRLNSSHLAISYALFCLKKKT